MAVTTQFGNARPMPKSFSWSYSKLKNYETCPKRHYHVDVKKDFKEAEGEALRQGNFIHKILDDRIGRGRALPKDYQYLEPWAQRVLTGPGEVKTEMQYAITKDFAPCAWFDSENPPDKKAWYRAKADVVKINGPAAIAIDWKTGKIVVDSPQLLLTAVCMFIHHPELQVVKSMYAWLADGAETTEIIQRHEVPAIWNNLWSRIETLRHAHEQIDFPPTPSHLCAKWCPVKSCPHHGESGHGR